ncbi:MAG: 4-hydroxythreonine-4-phosphate dehydrogenase PdxA, partial [Calditrichaeota bacterium]
GQISAAAGDAAFQAVKKAIELALAGKIDAIVTNPIHKEALNLAGHHFAGHTEILAHFTRSKDVAMLLVHGNLRVIHVSTHVPLRRACDLVKKARVVRVIQLLHDACRRFGVKRPRIGVAGLNPHASDGGLFGKEEAEEILPAVQEAQAAGLDVEGPMPPDTLFAKAAGGFYDGVVAMYHDQGHIPFKLQTFTFDDKRRVKAIRGVNITLGLPIIRTSVDHGTAFDIAGKGLANPETLIEAIEYAAKMAGNRRH